jgi:hypothetical protein
MSIIDKIEDYLGESGDIKSQKAKALGLEHVAFNTYKDKAIHLYSWNKTKQDFVKVNEPTKMPANDDEDEQIEYFKDLKAKALGLTHVNGDKYKDSANIPWYWDWNKLKFQN